MNKITGEPLARILKQDTDLRKTLGSIVDPCSYIVNLAIVAYGIPELRAICTKYNITDADLSFILGAIFDTTTPDPTILTEDNIRVTVGSYFLYHTAALELLFMKCYDSEEEAGFPDGTVARRTAWLEVIQSEARQIKREYLETYGAPSQTGDPFTGKSGCLGIIVAALIAAFVLLYGSWSKTQVGVGEIAVRL